MSLCEGDIFMMVVGVDPHKQSHTAVAVDELGRKQAQKTVAARRDGHLQLVAWARQAAPRERLWAVEDVRHVAGNLIRVLLAAGESVVFVPPRMMAGERRGGRERGKSDPIDALAIARLALREDGHLQAACLDERTRPVRLLVDHRDALVKDRTAMINRLRWHLHDLDPALAPATRALSGSAARRRLAARLAAMPASTARRVAAAQLALIAVLSAEIDAIEAELAPLVTALAPALLALPGTGVLTAAKLLGEIGDIQRFRSPAAFARHNGTAPIPVQSGASSTWRLNRAGNRQLNAALHRIAVTQARCHPAGRALLTRRAETTRETRKASLRVLKRHLSDVIYHAMTTDSRSRHALTPSPHPTAT
jgi:transposase